MPKPPTPTRELSLSDLLLPAGDVASGPDLTTTRNIERPRVYRAKPRRKYLNAIKREALDLFLTELPEPGETWHIVSNGTFDYWTFCPTILRLIRPRVATLAGTWTMNRSNVNEMFDLFDAGKLCSISILTGTYFKTRESSVANTLIEGMIQRGQRYRAFQNHAKVMLISAPPDYYVLEGSANWTANPRLEQNTLSNDRALWDFHKTWMEEMLR